MREVHVIGVNFDLDAVGEMLGRLVNHHMPAGHKEKPVFAFEEETARAGQQPCANESLDPSRGQQQWLDLDGLAHNALLNHCVAALTSQIAFCGSVIQFGIHRDVGLKQLGN